MLVIENKFIGDFKVGRVSRSNMTELARAA
jgi:aspartate carbamoyltransferase catalytic subunit